MPTQPETTVGVAGIAPAASRAQAVRSTWLSYTPENGSRASDTWVTARHPGTTMFPRELPVSAGSGALVWDGNRDDRPEAGDPEIEARHGADEWTSWDGTTSVPIDIGDNPRRAARAGRSRRKGRDSHPHRLAADALSGRAPRLAGPLPGVVSCAGGRGEIRTPKPLRTTVFGTATVTNRWCSSVDRSGASGRTRTSSARGLKPPTLPLVYGGGWGPVETAGLAPAALRTSAACSAPELRLAEWWKTAGFEPATPRLESGNHPRSTRERMRGEDGVPTPANRRARSALPLSYVSRACPRQDSNLHCLASLASDSFHWSTWTCARGRVIVESEGVAPSSPARQARILLLNYDPVSCLR